MSTRCAIGLLRPNGTVLTIYNHHDGYPSGVGVCLLESYANEERIKALLELGSISSIGKYLSKEELKATEATPTKLHPWDPMGTLAD